MRWAIKRSWSWWCGDILPIAGDGLPQHQVLLPGDPCRGHGGGESQQGQVSSCYQGALWWIMWRSEMWFSSERHGELPEGASVEKGEGRQRMAQPPTSRVRHGLVIAIYFTLTKIIEVRYLNTFQDGGGKPSGIVGWWGGSSNCHGWRGADHQRNCLFRLIANLERMWSLSETYK